MTSQTISLSLSKGILHLGIYLAILFFHGCGDEELPTQPTPCRGGPVTCTNFQDSMRWVGSLFIEDSINGLTMSGDLVFAMTGGGIVQVIDISDPASPIEVTRFGANRPCGFEISQSGEYAFVANWRDLTVYSLADPSTPQFLAQIRLSGADSGYPVRLQVLGQYAYVVSGDGILRIVDITQPDAPFIVSRTATGNQQLLYHLLVVEGMAYLSNDRQFFAVDVSNPQHPALYNAGVPAFPLEDATPVGAHIITRAETNSSYQYEIWDVSDPLAPIFVNSLDLPCGGKIEIEGETAVYYGPGGQGLTSVDASDLHNPRILGVSRCVMEANHLCFDGRLAVTAGGGDSSSNYLAVFDVSNSSSIDLRGNLDALQNVDRASSCVVEDETLYLATQPVGLMAVDISEPSCPVVLTTMGLPDGAASLTCKDQKLYITNDDGLVVFDVSSAESPIEITSIALLGSLVDVALTENIAVLLGKDGMVHTVSFENEERPQLLGSVRISGYPRALAIGQTSAFVAAGYSGELHIVDISDPVFPSILSSIPIGGDPQDVALVDTIALVHDGQFLTVVDVSAPASPFVLSELQLYLGRSPQWNRGCSIHVGERNVYASTPCGVDVLDLTIFSEPKILGSAAAVGTQSFIVHEEALFIAATDELKVFSAHCDQ